VPLSSRSKLDIAGFQLLAVRVEGSKCEVPYRPAADGHCGHPGVMVLRYMYRTKSGAIKTAHEVQCVKHLAEWKAAHGEQLELFAR